MTFLGCSAPANRTEIVETHGGAQNGSRDVKPGHMGRSTAVVEAQPYVVASLLHKDRHNYRQE